MNRLIHLPVLLWILMAASSAPADIIVSFDPTPKSAGIGERFSIDLVANIPPGQAIIGWGVDYVFQTLGIVIQDGSDIGPVWDAAITTPDGDGLAGLAPAPPGTGIWGESVLLATIHLEALTAGTTVLLVGDSFPDDPTEGFAISPDQGGGFADVSYKEGLIIVPSPSSAGLLLLGVLALGRRRLGLGLPSPACQWHCR